MDAGTAVASRVSGDHHIYLARLRRFDHLYADIHGRIFRRDDTEGTFSDYRDSYGGFYRECSDLTPRLRGSRLVADARNRAYRAADTPAMQRIISFAPKNLLDEKPVWRRRRENGATRI